MVTSIIFLHTLSVLYPPLPIVSDAPLPSLPVAKVGLHNLRARRHEPLFGTDCRIRTDAYGSQSPVPFRLAKSVYGSRNRAMSGVIGFAPLPYRVGGLDPSAAYMWAPIAAGALGGMKEVGELFLFRLYYF